MVDIAVYSILSNICSITYKMPHSTCDLVRHSVKKNMVVTLIRELNMETSGNHRPFIKERHSSDLYYGNSMEVICENSSNNNI